MPAFGDLEAEIMDVVWSTDEPVTVRHVVDRLNEQRAVAYTTVQTVAEILFRKGWLQRSKVRRAYQYWPTRSRADYTAGLVAEALSATPDRAAALVRLFDHLDPGEVAELRAALNSAKTAKNRSQ
ncbi:BlaI/MecI/CopY family transcriptional regulator [Saccharopolyspora sp. SCSIO 74807]|uniref:BlaI/MecI/CopY family transcriptional regulator n=1 Tax=Saccharopolyspora sp. SCSIO 74807 TaxID=3118084 RepID=UPI0030CC5D2F